MTLDLKVFMCQINPILGDLEGNLNKILHGIDEARRSNADIVLFPELSLSGYPPEDLLFHGEFLNRLEENLERITFHTQGLMVVVGFPRRNPGGEKGLFNSAAIMIDEKIQGYQDKILLPTYDVFSELRYFDSGEKVSTYEFKGKKVACLICEDIWQHAGLVEETHYRRDPVSELIPLKPDLLLNLSASPYNYQKMDRRLSVCKKAAQTLKCPLFLCCQVGANDQLIFDGYSLAVDDKGELIKIGLGFVEEGIFIDLRHSREAQKFSIDPLEDLYRALILGVRDYFQKQGFQKALFGLSGGIDSALVACIAVDALGKENVLGVMMPSRYSKAESLTDSIELAKNLGIETKEISIEEPFEGFLTLLTPHFHSKKRDVTEENIQARIRGLILMALSNKLGHVVLSTGNKSEMALGYCTLYGDMCGGLGVLGDVNKTRVYALARLINQDKKIIPENILERAPSAELAPNQKDQDTLPDYAIVDAVLDGYVESHQTPSEIAKKHLIDFSVVLDLIQRIHKAEYKRRQAPPILRVTAKSFGAGRHYPIVEKWR